MWGVLRDIILLDYGHVSQLVILFKYDWVINGVDRWGNPAYKCDEDKFLLVNFQHLNGQVDEPYVFPA
jgi:hypothetical protein